MTNDEIKRIFLANGFTIKEGETDLKPYVYDAAKTLLDANELVMTVYGETKHYNSEAEMIADIQGRPSPVFSQDDHIVEADETVLGRDLRIVEATIKEAATIAEWASGSSDAFNAVLAIDKAQILRDMDKK